MPIKNSHAGCCYLCANYVGIGAGELVKYKVQGQKYSIRCASCSTRAREATTRPTEAVMSEGAQRLFRQSLRAEILQLLTTDKDIPSEKIRPGQAWLEVPGRSIDELADAKEKLIQLRNTRRDNRLNGRAQAA